MKGTGGQLSGMGAGELETTNAMLRPVIDGIADRIYVKDAEGRYLLVNPAVASATGLRPDQILGHTTDEERAGTKRRRLLGRLHDIQEEERGRIAVGLHDGPLQGLATLGFKLARARALLAEGRARAALAVLGECEADVAGEVLLTVSDDGCGFDPARVAGGGGFRFGLTVMTERVKALGGRLAVRSRAGGGTTVEARILGLPARLEGPPRVTRLPPRPRVLLADDHTRLREALRDLLEETGFEVVGESGDGADAVAMAGQLEPDIVVIALRMPALNGLDATRLIRDARPATQVVVLSAFESPELERQAREAGAFAYLDKGTMARRVHRVLLGAAVQAVLDTNLGAPGGDAETG